MAVNPAQFLNPQLWGGFTQNNQDFSDITYEPARKFLTEINSADNFLKPPAQTQAETTSVQTQPTGDKLFFKGIPVPISVNNPLLAYLPKPGRGMIVTKKFIQDAINWENQEQARQEVEANRGKMAGVVLRALSEAAGNPNIMPGNRDIINFYGGLTDLIKLPGGEAVAEKILNDIRRMYEPKEQKIDPLAQLKAEELQARINKTNKEAALLGLQGSEDERTKTLKFYNDAYDRYLKTNGAKWNPYANGGEGGWEFPGGFQPLPQDAFIEQTYGAEAANDYVKALTGRPAPVKATPGNKVKKPVYKPNANYDKTVWDDAEVLSNTYGGPGKTLIYLATKGAKPTDPIFKALVDRYNQNNSRKKGYVPYTPQRFYDAFILNKPGSRNQGRIAEDEQVKKG